MEKTAIDKRRKHYRARQEVWDMVRDGWAKGYPATLLAAHYGPGRTTIHKRAKAERWRRPDAPEVAPLPHLRVAERTTEGRGGSVAPLTLGAEPRVGGQVEAAPPETLADAVEAVVRLVIEAAGDRDRAASASAFALLAERLMRLESRRHGAATAGFTPAEDVIAVLAERFGAEPRP